MSGKIATREAYGKMLAELGETCPDLVVLDADLSCSTKTNIFAKKFPERFFNVGVAEQNLIGWAAGLAVSGKVPFASTFAVFATARAFDQVRNSVAFPNVNVKIAASHAGLSVGADGASHQSIEDIALMRIMPNFTVVVPADGPQAALATRLVYEHRGPVYLRLGRPAVEDIPASVPFVLGQAQILRRGTDATVIACGTMVRESLLAADDLGREGVSVRVINMHTIKPLDQAAVLEAARQTGAVITAEEHTIIGGLGSAVAEVLAEAGGAVPFRRLGVSDQFGESGEPEELFERYGINARHIAAAVRAALAGKR
ncbi:transketolase family protein [candidate division FCPU426 bacterium]|nr:transketolase family protein [candidate division FCPU426 bacterium]